MIRGLLVIVVLAMPTYVRTKEEVRSPALYKAGGIAHYVLRPSNLVPQFHEIPRRLPAIHQYHHLKKEERTLLSSC